MRIDDEQEVMDRVWRMIQVNNCLPSANIVDCGDYYAVTLNFAVSKLRCKFPKKKPQIRLQPKSEAETLPF